ncbi:MarR family winged helix-turn-helix transcriptional regulator [Microbacterium sp. 179-B 1A2 NHS]|uniref:MarR family winged helix-turn-helix transcriptional regulator n=1 Tax=Microbacterium sp. 179-B 1A2 NHS TaxID=3142383 RepID=UPI00399F82C8
MNLHDELVYEHMLLSRVALHGVAPYARQAELDRSAAVLLSRLEAQGPMTIGELADAFGLDVSTVHRQVAAAMKDGLIERTEGPRGAGARTHQASAEGRRRLRAELEGRRTSVERVTREWDADELAEFVRLMRRFNEGAESVRERPWPRPDREAAAD